MRCRKVRSFLSTYSKGETTPEESAWIESHIKGCNSCRREYDVYQSLNASFQELPKLKTSDDFNARLFQKIGQQGFAEKRTKAYLPGKIPRFGTMRLATYAATAVIILALGIAMNVTDNLLGPLSPKMATTVPGDGHGNDMYLTVQPTDNPLLNERKSVPQMVQQYNRFRAYSKSLRTSGAVEQLMGASATMASGNAGTSFMNPNLRVRPVIKNYLIRPGNNNVRNAGAVY